MYPPEVLFPSFFCIKNNVLSGGFPVRSMKWILTYLAFFMISLSLCDCSVLEINEPTHTKSHRQYKIGLRNFGDINVTLF